MSVKDLEFKNYSVYKPLKKLYDVRFYIPDVTYKGKRIGDIKEFNVFERVDEEEGEYNIVFFPFNGHFLDKVLELHREVGEYIEIEHHLRFNIGDEYIPHMRKYGNTFVFLYTDLDEFSDLNKMFVRFVKTLRESDLVLPNGKYAVKIRIDYKYWKMLYSSSKVSFSEMEKYNNLGW